MPHQVVQVVLYIADIVGNSYFGQDHRASGCGRDIWVGDNRSDR